MINPQIMEKENDIKKLTQILKTFGEIYAKADDVHKHSKFLGETCRTIIRPLDIKYNLSNIEKNLLLVIDEIKSCTPSDKLPAVTKVLETVLKSGGNIEPETGFNVQELLIRTWFLANSMAAPDNSRELVIDNLFHNIAANGGCLAGISARLIQPYSNFVKWTLDGEQNLDFELQQALIISKESEEVAQAKRLSLLISDNQQTLQDRIKEAMQNSILDEIYGVNSSFSPCFNSSQSDADYIEQEQLKEAMRRSRKESDEKEKSSEKTEKKNIPEV